MAIETQKAFDIVRGVLSGDPRDETQHSDIVNGAIKGLENMHEWAFLQDQIASLDLVNNQPFVEFPPGKIVRTITGWDATNALVSSLTFTDIRTLIRLRTQRIINSSLHFWGAITHLQIARKNLLLQTENIDDAPAGSPWLASPLAVALNAQKNPIDGLQNAESLSDTDALAFETIAQDVDYPLLSDGIYNFSIHLKNSTSTTSTIELSVVGGTSRFRATITWGATPTIAEETQVGGTFTAALTELVDGWVRVSVALTYVQTEENGTLRVTIGPAGPTVGDTGLIFAWGAQLERTLQSLWADYTSGSNSGPTKYEKVGSKAPIGGPQLPVLSIWPIPTADAAGRFSIYFKAGIPRVGEADEVIAVPDWMDEVFIELLRITALGWEKHGELMLHQRLQGFKESDMVQDAMERDDPQTDYGPMEGGAVRSNRFFMDWDTGRQTTPPS